MRARCGGPSGEPAGKEDKRKENGGKKVDLDRQNTVSGCSTIRWKLHVDLEEYHLERYEMPQKEDKVTGTEEMEELRKTPRHQ